VEIGNQRGISGLVVLDDVRFSYTGGLGYALRGVSLTIPSPGVYAVVGPNGSGKTTLLRVVAGLLRPFRGVVRVLGADPSRDLWVRRFIGYQGGNPGFYPGMSVFSNLLFYCTVKLGDEAYCRDEVPRLAALLGMEGYLDRKVKELSQGYLQRASILRALIGRPRVVLLDEPFAHLDTSAVGALKKLLIELGGEAAVIFTSHALHTVAEVADRVAVLSEGRLLFYGGRNELEKAVGVPLDKISIDALVSALSRGSA